MAGIVLYNDDLNRASQIANNLSYADGFDYSLCKVNGLFNVCIDETERVVFPWEARKEVFHFLYTNSDKLKISIYNNDFYTDIDDLSEVKKVIDDSLKAQKWNLCKGINEVIAYSNVLRRKVVLDCKPQKLQIETTDMCNAKCIMCSHAFHNGSGFDIVENGILDKISSLLPFLRVVVLHGNGEPFISKSLIKLLSELKKYNIKFISNSNLSVVNEDLIPFLRNDFIELNVSCDAHTKELYESIRGGLDFDKFVHNVIYVRSQCPELTMKMAVVVMRQNLAFLSEIVKFAYELGFNEVDLNQLCVDENNGNIEDAPYLYVDLYKESVAKAIAMAMDLGIEIKYPKFAGNCPAENINAGNGYAGNGNPEDDYAGNGNPEDDYAGNGHTEDVDYSSGICDWLIESPYINLKGNVGICCINQNVKLGNVFETDFDAIWNGKEYVLARNMFYSGKIASYCNGCDFLLQDRLKYINLQKIEIVKNNRV